MTPPITPARQAGIRARKLWMPAFLLAGLSLGCTAAQLANAKGAARTATTAALGLVTLAVNHPELVDEAKAALVDAMGKVDPKDAPALIGVLAHVNAGNLGTAQTDLTAIAGAQAP